MKQKSILCFLWFLQGPGLGFEFVEVFGLTVVFRFPLRFKPTFAIEYTWAS